MVRSVPELGRRVAEDDILTAEEAARLLRVSTKTLLRHAREGVIPGVKVGRMWRFRRDDLIALLSPEVASS